MSEAKNQMQVLRERADRMEVMLGDLNDGIQAREAQYVELSGDLRKKLGDSEETIKRNKEDLFRFRHTSVTNMGDIKLLEHKCQALEYSLTKGWYQYLLSFIRKPVRIFK